MHRTTRAQREALFKVFQRSYPSWISPGWRKSVDSLIVRVPLYRYREFRRTTFIAFGDCVMVPWKGMVLGIEKDGYTHS